MKKEYNRTDPFYPPNYKKFDEADEVDDEKDDEYGAIEDYKKGVNNHGAENDI